MSDIVYNPLRNRDPLAKEVNLSAPGFQALTAQEAYWQERAMISENAYKELKSYINDLLVPTEPGRIVVLYCNGQTWMRIPGIESRTRFRTIAQLSASGRWGEALTEELFGTEPVQNVSIERVRRNNVVE